MLSARQIACTSTGRRSSGLTGRVLLLALTLFPAAAWPQGMPLGPEFRVNTYTTSEQRYPSLGADASGSFVVAWQSYTQDGSRDGVFGQRYGEVIPVELMRLTVE